MSAEMPPTQTFPDQIILEILTRLPVKKVFQAKLLSKEWNSNLSNPHFISTYISRAPTNWIILDRVVIASLTESTHFLLNSPSRVSSLTISPPILYAGNNNAASQTFPAVISASNGLVLLASSFPNNRKYHDLFSTRTKQDLLFVINTVTRDCASIPIPPKPINHRGSIAFTVRVNYLTRVLDCFLVVEYRPLVGSEYATLLCFSSQNWKWEEFTGVYMLNNHMWRSDGSFEIHGTLFWVDLSVGLIYLNGDVDLFGMGKRRNKPVNFGFVKLPEGCQCRFNIMGLEKTRYIDVGVDSLGEKCVQFLEMRVKEQVMNLWRLKDYKSGVWNLVCKVPFVERDQGLMPKPLFFHPLQADVIYCVLGEELVILYLRTRQIKYCERYSNSAGLMFMLTVVIPSWPSTLPTPSAEVGKERGNEYFKAKEYEEAIFWYSRSIIRSPTAVAYANRAAAYLNLQNFLEAEKDCTNALKLDAQYMKAYWRRVVARKELGKFGEALEDAQHALSINPIQLEMQTLCAEVKALMEQAAPEEDGKGSMVSSM